MNRLVMIMLGVAATATMAPSAAFAALDLRIGPNRGPDAVDAVVAPGLGEQFFDFTFSETGTPNNEGLWAYDVMVRAPRPGITLLRAEKPADNWVIDDPDGMFTTLDAAADHILLEGLAAEVLSDMTTGDKAARVYYRVEPGAAAGLYRLTLDPSVTTFQTGEPSGILQIAVDISDPGVVLVTPEPSGLALLGAAGLLLSRRVGHPHMRRATG